MQAHRLGWRKKMAAVIGILSTRKVSDRGNGGRFRFRWPSTSCAAAAWSGRCSAWRRPSWPNCARRASARCRGCAGRCGCAAVGGWRRGAVPRPRPHPTCRPAPPSSPSPVGWPARAVPTLSRNKKNHYTTTRWLSLMHPNESAFQGNTRWPGVSWTKNKWSRKVFKSSSNKMWLTAPVHFF